MMAGLRQQALVFGIHETKSADYERIEFTGWLIDSSDHNI